MGCPAENPLHGVQQQYPFAAAPYSKAGMLCCKTGFAGLPLVIGGQVILKVPGVDTAFFLALLFFLDCDAVSLCTRFWFFYL